MPDIVCLRCGSETDYYGRCPGAQTRCVEDAEFHRACPDCGDSQCCCAVVMELVNPKTIVLPDTPSPVEVTLLAKISLADAATHAALQQLAALVAVIREVGGFLRVEHQFALRDAEQMLKEMGSKP